MREIVLVLGALVMIALAGLHSYVGETRLWRQLLLSNLPIFQGSVEYTPAVLRWAWHLTSLAWLGFATLFIGLTQIPLQTRPLIGFILAGVLASSALVASAATRGRHPAWIFSSFSAVCALLGTP